MRIGELSTRSRCFVLGPCVQTLSHEPGQRARVGNREARVTTSDVRHYLTIAGVLASLTLPARADRTTASVTANGDVSATDNVFATPRDVRESDVSFALRPGILFGYDGPRASHEAGLEGEVLEFARHSQKPSVSVHGTLRTRIQTTKFTSFIAQLDASNGVLTALSSRSTPDLTGPQVTPIGRIDTQNAAGSMGFSWDTGHELTLTESVFARIGRSDDNADDTPGVAAPTIITSTESGGSVSLERSLGRSNAISLETGVSVLRLERDAPPTAMLGPRLDHQLNPHLRAQWRHDYNRSWSSTADVGAVLVHPYGTDPDNPDAKHQDGIFPVFGAAAAYTEIWGRAQIAARREVSPNLLVAQNTVNDLATVNMALPLPWLDDSRRREPKLIALGSFGVSRTQLIDSETSATTSSFYVGRVDFGVGYSPRPGFTYGVRYELQYQTGDARAEMVIPGFWRQTLSFTFQVRYPDRANGELARRQTNSVRADGKDLVPIGIDPINADVLKDDETPGAGGADRGGGGNDD